MKEKDKDGSKYDGRGGGNGMKEKDNGGDVDNVINKEISNQTKVILVLYRLLLQIIK